MTKTLWFVAIKNKEGKLTIQSEVGETFDEAAEKVLKNPKLDNVVAYKKLDNEEFVWVNIDEQN